MKKVLTLTKVITMLIALSNFPLSLIAQTDSVSKSKISFFSKVLKNAELRQSFGSAATRNEPVVFQFTLPKEGKGSYLVDGGIGLPFANGKLTDGLDIVGKLIGEYHRNTLVDEAQYTWQTGFSSTIRTHIHQRGNTFTQFYFTPTLKYSRNVVDNVNSFIVSMDAAPFRSSNKGLNLNTYTFSRNKSLIHLISILPGFEFQNNFAANSQSSNGTILRPAFKTQYNIAGNKRRIPTALMVEPIKTWEASVDYTLRYAVVNSTLTGEKFSNLLKTGIDYYLLTQPVAISFGVSFNYGSDPLQGLKKQQFWLATISIQK